MDTSIRYIFNAINQHMAGYGMCYELKFETLSQEQKDLLGIKLSEFPHIVLKHLGKFYDICTLYTQSVPLNAVLTGLVLCSFIASVPFIFPLWCIRQLTSCIEMALSKNHVITLDDPIKHKELVLEPPRSRKNLDKPWGHSFPPYAQCYCNNG